MVSEETEFHPLGKGSCPVFYSFHSELVAAALASQGRREYGYLPYLETEFSYQGSVVGMLVLSGLTLRRAMIVKSGSCCSNDNIGIATPNAI